jgi:hypothetical protein
LVGRRDDLGVLVLVSLAADKTYGRWVIIVRCSPDVRSVPDLVAR